MCVYACAFVFAYACVQAKYINDLMGLIVKEMGCLLITNFVICIPFLISSLEYEMHLKDCGIYWV